MKLPPSIAIQSLFQGLKLSIFTGAAAQKFDFQPRLSTKLSRSQRPNSLELHCHPPILGIPAAPPDSLTRLQNTPLTHKVGSSKCSMVNSVKVSMVPLLVVDFQPFVQPLERDAWLLA
jgi:hypothetical protein